MNFSKFLDSDDDWIESFRRYVYPRLHPHLQWVGNRFGARLYAIGETAENQHVGDFDVDPEVFEEILVDLHFERNPVACYKSTENGLQSIGSWVLRSHDDTFDLLDQERQLHVTLYARKGGTAIYAHNEWDWQDKPLTHLQGTEFRPTEGCTQMEWILDNHTYLDSLSA